MPPSPVLPPVPPSSGQKTAAAPPTSRSTAAGSDDVLEEGRSGASAVPPPVAPVPPPPRPAAAAPAPPSRPPAAAAPAPPPPAAAAPAPPPHPPAAAAPAPPPPPPAAAAPAPPPPPPAAAAPAPACCSRSASPVRDRARDASPSGSLSAGDTRCSSSATATAAGQSSAAACARSSSCREATCCRVRHRSSRASACGWCGSRRSTARVALDGRRPVTAVLGVPRLVVRLGHPHLVRGPLAAAGGVTEVVPVAQQVVEEPERPGEVPGAELRHRLLVEGRDRCLARSVLRRQLRSGTGAVVRAAHHLEQRRVVAPQVEHGGDPLQGLLAGPADPDAADPHRLGDGAVVGDRLVEAGGERLGRRVAHRELHRHHRRDAGPGPGTPRWRRRRRRPPPGPPSTS